MIKPIILTLFLTFFSVSGFGTHIMGANMSYKYVSSTANDITYIVTLQMYRDCRGGISTTVQFNPEINIGIYHNNTAKSLYRKEKVKLLSKKIVDISGCIEVNFCVEAALYEAKITLDKSALGYYLTHEVCCRSNLTNVKNNGSAPDNGYTFLTLIPPTAITNTSPFFNFDPTLVYGINKTNEDNWGATDGEGDSLVYSMAAPYHGSSLSSGSWDPPSNMAGPVSVSYNSGYSFTTPLGSTGSISMDQATGRFSFSNTKTGEYAFCVEIKEYRKGVLIGVHRKDYPLIFINTPPESDVKIKLLHPKFVTNKWVSLSWQICPNSFPTYSIYRKEKFTNWTKVGEWKTRDNFNNTIENNIMYYYMVKATINSIEYASNLDSAYISLSGSKQYQSTQTAIYPNPSKTYLSIHALSLIGYSIYDITGKMLLQSMEVSNTRETKIDIRSLNPGIYFIALKTEKGIFTQRFVKE